MENKTFWWLKSSRSDSQLGKSIETNENITSTPQIEEEISSSLAEFIEKEKSAKASLDKDDDIGSIIEKMNRLAAESPLGPYENDQEERSVEDIMKEAERLYMESSKSFEQLSVHSKTSQNLTDMLNSQNSSEASTPTPKSASPLPLDSERSRHTKSSESESYSDDFYEERKSNAGSWKRDVRVPRDEKDEVKLTRSITSDAVSKPSKILEKVSSESSSTPESVRVFKSSSSPNILGIRKEVVEFKLDEVKNSTFVVEEAGDNEEVAKLLDAIEQQKEDMGKKEGIIRLLIEDNKKLKENIQDLETKLEQTANLLEQTRSSLRGQSLKSPELDLELEKALEEVKDTKEINTSLQLQLDNINKSHQLLKTSYEDVLSSNKNLERRLVDTESLLTKYKTELTNVQKHRDKLLESEASLNKLLEIEKLQAKTLKIQTEKDAKCIMDLNRQIKEMERIIARKHPDSVSALILASKNDPVEGNSSARKVLEDRIRNLEQEAAARDAQSSKVFLEVQEKFNQMKLKYESHIEDLELHVNDLKDQLKRRIDTYDVYTQTFFNDQKIPEKEKKSRGIQTVAEKQQPQRVLSANKKFDKAMEKEETHLLATIRGLQADLSNKEKVIIKLQKEIDELRKTNRRLQKEREGSLKSLSDKKEFRSYPEKLSNHGADEGLDHKLSDELKAMKAERDKMKLQLVRIEDDYQQLKTKRLQDLTALQEAHEREISTYLANITPLREQLEVQQVTISTLQNQLGSAKEELAIVSVERDHLNNRINCGANLLNYTPGVNDNEDDDLTVLRKKIAYLEQKHQEREHRLHAIVHGLAQKNVTNRSCEQCAARQQQLIGYKAELDQLLATLRCLQ